jgi:hypothetical protein
MGGCLLRLEYTWSLVILRFSSSLPQIGRQTSKREGLKGHEESIQKKLQRPREFISKFREVKGIPTHHETPSSSNFHFCPAKESVAIRLRRSGNPFNFTSSFDGSGRSDIRETQRSSAPWWSQKILDTGNSAESSRPAPTTSSYCRDIAALMCGFAVPTCATNANARLVFIDENGGSPLCLGFLLTPTAAGRSPVHPADPGFVKHARGDLTR